MGDLPDKIQERSLKMISLTALGVMAAHTIPALLESWWNNLNREPSPPTRCLDFKNSTNVPLSKVYVGRTLCACTLDGGASTSIDLPIGNRQYEVRVVFKDGTEISKNVYVGEDSRRLVFSRTWLLFRYKFIVSP